MNLSDLLDWCRADGVTLGLAGAQLRVRTAGQAVSPSLLAALREHKAALIAWLGDGERQLAELARPPLLAGLRRDPLPLSFAQQRLWFLDRFQGGSAHYNMPAALRLAGPLDVAALQRALSAIAARHEAIRTRFAEVDGVACQVIGDDATVSLSLTVLDPAVRDAALAAALAEEAERPFDLAADLMLRARLLRCGPDEHVLLLTMHHIASDGWSLAVLGNELARLYDAFASGATPALAPLPLQYADYACWQRDWLQGDVLQAQLDYWRERLAGLPPVHALPLDRPRPAVVSYRGAVYGGTVDTAVARAFNALCRDQGATLFMGLHAAFSVLLSRYSGETDIVVGTPVANREQAEVAGLIGFFVNTLVLRADLSGAPTFIELLAQSRATALGAYAHQQVPFESLVEVLQPERSLAHAPLFQVMLALQNNEQAGFELAGLRAELLPPAWQVAKFDLTLNVAERAGALELIWEYSTALFEEATIARMQAHFAQLLAAIVAAPAQPVATLPLLAEAELRQLAQWNDTTAPFSPLPVHEQFAARARSAPDDIAIVYEDVEMRYGELDRRANRLAHRLRAHGAGPDVLVAVSAQRTPALVVALLAVLKAGAAYLPLDPAYPAERLAYMLEDAAPALVLGEAALLAGLPSSGAVTLALDEDEGTWPDTAPAGATVPGDLAYVIYTSGSTGKPKGAMLSHLGLANLVQERGSTLAGKAGERMLQFASYAFDASVWEIFTALAAGATLCMAPREALMPGEPLQHTLQRLRVSAALLPPVALGMLDAAALPALTTLLSGGEACTAALARDWAQGRRFVNAYGPTEATVYVTLHALDGNGAGDPPLGRAIDNVQLHVLDGWGNLVPPGVPGELYVGGIGLARGYLNRPDLTAERFVPDPFGAPGGRLYRTGDRVRFTATGELLFLGRTDRQVKLRGFRIEPGEIEAALAALPGVRESLVLVAGEGMERRLVAYATAPAEVMPAALRDALAATLPPHMVPAQVVVLDAFPLTANGKIDKARLPAPAQTDDSDEPARPGTEQLLATLWQQVLRLDMPPGRQANFFAQGGHSLLATRLTALIRQALGVEIALHVLFEAQTLAALAARVEEGAAASRPPLLAGRRREPLPLSFAQQRLWFLDRFQGGSAHYNMPAALRLAGPLDVAALQRALSAIAARHEAIRTRFAEVDGVACQVIGDDATVPLSLTVLDPAVRDAALAAALAEEAERPFDLAADLMLRARLLRCGPDEHVLLLTMHHIASDGWSLAVLGNELARLYDAFASGATPALAPLPLQYADYACWQRDWLQGDVLQAQLDYWRERLAGLPPVHALPLDRPRPAVVSYRGAVYGGTVDAAVAKAFNALCRDQGATLFMGLHAAFSVLLSRYSGETDIVVGTPVANREQAEVAGLIGFFVNTLVLRADLSGAPTFIELLAQSRATALGAYAHQQVPFESLVEVLQPERSLAHAPLFQVMLALQNNEQAGFELAGLRAELLPPAWQVAKFDLTLNVAERAGALELIWEYSTALFEEATIARMQAHFAQLLAAIVAAPAQPVATLPLLAEAELRQLAQWNDTAAPFSPLPVHEQFAARARSAPDDIAIVYEDVEMRYGELDRRANRLAHRLRAHGAGPDVLVAVSAQRTPALVVALLAVLKAGAAYLPLDPAYPAERLAYMLEDAAPALVLGEAALLAGLPSSGAVALALDEDEGTWPDTAPAGATVPGDLAYVIYTSGSTGKPKGAMLSHLGLANLVQERGSTLAGKAGERMLQFASYAFDASVWEIFTALAAGATLCMAPREALMPGEPLQHTLQRLRVSAALLPPVALGMLDAAALPALTTLLSGGEACTAALARDWAQGRRFVNAYGPTEATVYVTLHALDGNGAGDPPLGRAIDNVQLHVLDGWGNLVPPGVPGELYVGGIGLARGYLNRPDLTAERFVPDPFGAPGGRLYRTGDRVRFTATGELLFLGRTDRQVKLRGFRIEPGEIEAALAALPGVRESLVVVAGEGVQRRLVAYATAPAEVMPATLRDALAATLPPHMVPAQVVVLDAFPLTANGKIDKARLPVPAQPASADMPPQGPVETVMAAIWTEALGHPVGRHDNFFALGGHSLLAVRIYQEMKQRLHVPFALAELFRTPTIAGLAALTGSDGASTPLVTLAGQPGQPALFCVHPVGGAVFCYEPLAARLGRDYQVYGIQSRAAAGLEPMTGTPAQQCVAAMRAAQAHGPYRLLGWSSGGLLAAQVAQLLEAQGEQVDYLALVDVHALDRVGTDPSDGVLLAMLAEMRGRGFDDAELRQMWEQAADGQARWTPEFLSQWSGRAISPATAAVLRQQVDLAAAQVHQLANTGPATVAANCHLLTASAPLPGPAPGASRGWLKANTVLTEVVAGDHFSIMQAGVDALATAILRALDRAAAREQAA